MDKEFAAGAGVLAFFIAVCGALLWHCQELAPERMKACKEACAPNPVHECDEGCECK